MILIEGLAALDLNGRCGVETAFDIGMEGRLVVLDGQKVVCGTTARGDNYEDYF
jgi:hypothetical protein